MDTAVTLDVMVTLADVVTRAAALGVDVYTLAATGSQASLLLRNGDLVSVDRLGDDLGFPPAVDRLGAAYRSRCGMVNGMQVRVSTRIMPAQAPPACSGACCGVAPPPEGARHTALGDARWARRWWDALTGYVPPADVDEDVADADNVAGVDGSAGEDLDVPVPFVPTALAVHALGSVRS